MSESLNTGARLEWALRYIKLGWPVFPLQGKIPLKGSSGSKEATLNESQVREWWARSPKLNIGIATLHRFFVLDVDIKKGGEESFDFLVSHHGRFPDTIEQVTGSGGRHLLFAVPDFQVLNSESYIASGIDIRGAGGYIVASNSVHPETGREYFWDGIAEIEDQAIAAAPAWLLEKLRDQKNQSGRPGSAAALPPEISEGGRNARLFKAACSMRRKGFSEDEIFATIRAVNDARCRPPLPENELRTIAKSSARYAPDQRASVFSGRLSSPKTPEENGDKGDAEIPLTLADVEAAVKDVIARNSVIDAFRLAPEVAKLKPSAQAVIIVELKLHFGRDFATGLFERAMKDAESGGKAGKVVVMPVSGGSPDDPPEEDGKAPEGPNLRFYPCTDSGNAERIVALFGNDIRYCTEMKKWLVWDGRRWAVDDADTVRQKAKLAARLLYAQAVGNRDLEKHARASESHAGIMSALARTADTPGIRISIQELDQHPFLLNCLNGAIDLKGQKLLPHDRRFLITKLCHVPYEPDAVCARFLQFVEWAMGANQDAELSSRTAHLVGFLQRAFGYALTGDVTEKALFVFYGLEGDNGKTTLLSLIRDLLGKDYSSQLSVDTLMASDKLDSNARADLADLRGARFVVISEVKKGTALNESITKYVTSGADAPIKSRRLYENPVEFMPTHKLFIDGNHRPAVKTTDRATWARLKLVPFDVRISEEQKDRGLKDKLRAEMAGILAWAVRGCAAWQRDGLAVPHEIELAIQEWREHDDPLKPFLEDCCEVGEFDDNGEERYVIVPDLVAAYEWWAKQNRERFPLGRESFNERLLSKGFKQNRSRRIAGRQARTWEGLELKDEVVSHVRKAPLMTSAVFDD